MAKLKCTSEHTIALVFLVMNLEKALRDLLLYLFEPVFRFLSISITAGNIRCSASGMNKCTIGLPGMSEKYGVFHLG